jgi:hypothetical protein
VATSEDFVQKALTQKGKPYVFGSNAQPLDPDPDNFDCAQLVYWALGRIGINAPSASFTQYPWTHHISVDQAIHTRGALIFEGVRTKVHHVVISLGDGTTIEARGRAWGVGCWAVSGRAFDGAGLVPGLTYVRAPTGTPVNQGGGVGIQPYSSGKAIAFLQAMLNIIRVHNKRSPIAVDGVYGNATKAAVAEVQSDWNHLPSAFRALKMPDGRTAIGALVVTGGADPHTCQAIAVSVKLITGR